MRRVFVDTSHLIGVPDDRLHRRALAVAEQLLDEGDARFVTTLLVLEEFLTDLSRRDAAMKERAAVFVEAILADRSFEIVDIDAQVFQARARPVPPAA